MALSLIESAKLALGRDETLKATVMELYAKSSDLLQYMPFESISGNSMVFNREQTLPAIGFRNLNEAYTEGSGTVDRVTEALAVAGGDLDVDVFLIKTGNADQRGTQEAMKIKALSLAMTKTIVKGDVGTTPNEFDGLQIRLVGNQLIVGGTTVTGDVPSLTKFDELIDAVDEPTHLVMNKTMRRRMSAAARLNTVGGYITYELDAFGRRVTRYNDLPILIVDKDNNYDDIMPFTELSSDAVTAVSTSIYCLSFSENGVVGLQNGDMNVRDMGEIDTKPVYRTRIEWYVSMAILRARAAARLYGVTNSAVGV